jgi:OPA family glycerol-3-phosphate transporter-like MFS transporter
MTKSNLPIHSKEFRRRRGLNWFSLGLMYAAFYMGRYNLAVANDTLRTTFGWTKEQIGLVVTAGLIVYGLSVLLNGPLADRGGGRKAILFGAVGTFAANILFGGGIFVRLLGYFVLVYAVNMYFQSFGALSVVKVNAAWFNIRERGTFAGVFGAMIQLGKYLAYGVGGFIIVRLPWQWAFWIPAIVLALVFVLNYFVVRDKPEELGFPRVDDVLEGEEDGEKPSFAFIFKRIFGSPTLWIIAGAMMCTGLIRHTLEQWGPSYFVEVLKVTKDSLVYQVAFVGQIITAIFGAMALGYISDKYFQSRRGPVTAFGYLGQMILLLIFALVHPSPWGAAVLLMLIFFFVNGCHGLLAGTASMDFGGRKAAASAAGLLDGCQYLVGSVVGVGMGWLLDKVGWDVWAWSIMPIALIGAILMATRWNVLPARASAATH